MTAHQQAVSQIAAYPFGSTAVGPVPSADWARRLDAIAMHRIAGHAVQAAAAGDLALTGSQTNELYLRHEEQLALDLHVEAMLLRCEEALANASIPTRLLKGPSIAHRFFPNPALRSFGDGDVLVRGTDMTRAIDTLTSAGFARRFGAPRRFFDSRYVKAVTLVAPDGLELDLHRAIAPGPFGVLIDPDSIFSAPHDEVTLGSRSVACLSTELALLHACVHATLGDVSPRLVALRDVVQILHSGVDEGLTIDYFSRYQCGIVAQRAVQLVSRVLGVDLVGSFAEWARAFEPTHVDEARLRAYSRSDKRYVAQAASTFWTLPSLRQRIEFAAALAFPKREYVRDRDRTYARRLTRSTTSVMRWRPR